MIKEEVISKVSDDTGYSRAVVSNVIKSLFDNITTSVSNGDKVQFAGFGTFEPKTRAARIGRNPHTKEAVPIPARVIASFKPGNILKDAMNKL